MCDTFVALHTATSDGSVIFGKNSDREPNEAQSLEYHAARYADKPTTVQCTYRTVPQVKETYAVLLCRPFWMWGAEMGANEKGVVIGNEAVWTRLPVERKGGLTGMDMLRLALERSACAAQAVDIIVALLSDFGQGGICGYENKQMAYHNSYLIADCHEGWVLETAGSFWAAKKINSVYSISNALTIGEEFDAAHPDLIDFARRKRWLKQGETFHFAHCYSDSFYTTFSASGRRRNRSFDLCNSRVQKLGIDDAFEILRDHEDGPYRPDSHLLGNRICAHAGYGLTRDATQTTGSLVAHLREGNQSYWATGTAAPCSSVFKPVWFTDRVLADIGPPPAKNFEPDSLWWYHEQLHRRMILDYAVRSAVIHKERNEIQNSLIDAAGRSQPDSRYALTQSAFRETREATGRWIAQIKDIDINHATNFLFRRYWNKQNRKPGIIM